MKEKKSSSKDIKLNKKLKITFIIFLITVIITLILILGKGTVFGFRLISISDIEEEDTHTIQLVAGSYYLNVDEGETEVYVTIDGEDVTEGYGLINSDDEIVSIDGNTITALEEGIVIITAVSDDYGVQSEITINVVKFATKLTIEAEYDTISIGEQTGISYATKPASASVSLSYSSSDESIATVDSNGIVTGISEGEVTITATDNLSGEVDSYEIEVEE